MIRIAVIAGTTRPGRKAAAVAEWLLDIARERGDADYELVDLADHPLPLLDEPLPPSAGQYEHAHTRAWADRIAPFDGYVFVTPEYNRSTSGALKNAIDFLYAEWADKAAGFVGYGSQGGVRAVEQLRLMMGELRVATVRDQVALSLFDDFAGFSVLRPRPHQRAAAEEMLRQLTAWSGALRALREPVAA